MQFNNINSQKNNYTNETITDDINKCFDLAEKSFVNKEHISYFKEKLNLLQNLSSCYELLESNLNELNNKCKSNSCCCTGRKCNKYKPSLIKTEIIEFSLWDIFKSLFLKNT